ncbi:MAG: 5'-3' exonuclease H3TH domain-containing protein [Planctomycetota bacterium]
MKTLYLIDGYAQFFRAYHAIRTPMTSPVTKEPTSATFGFVGMLLKLLRGEQPGQQALGGPPDYLAVTLDVSGDRGTFRSRLYPEYKATRSAIPDDLPPQIDRCIRLLAEIGVPTIGAEGYEADDVIASIASIAAEADDDLRVVIISKDKDLKQLLDAAGDGPGRVVMYDVHTDQATSAETLKEETGLSPGQVVDMLTLMGDTVDNVPGVEGVGAKTAAKLIAEYGSLDALMADAARDCARRRIGCRCRKTWSRCGGMSRQGSIWTRRRPRRSSWPSCCRSWPSWGLIGIRTTCVRSRGRPRRM